MIAQHNGMPVQNGISGFDSACIELYTIIQRDIESGKDITDSVKKLAALFNKGLNAVALEEERTGGIIQGDLALAKRVVYEILYRIVKTSDIGSDARTCIGNLLGNSSLFDLLSHDRFHVTQDWFSHNIPVWEKVLVSFRGKPNVKCLEIGSFEGLSACWLLENILTHHTCRIVCIDPFDSSGQLQAERNFDFNVQKTGVDYKVMKLKGFSRQALPLFSCSYFDIAYIDGSHHPVDTLQDALSVWPLVKKDGVIIFDDYAIGSTYPSEIAAGIDPKPGIDTFLSFVKGNYEVISDGWQMVIRKK